MAMRNGRSRDGDPVSVEKAAPSGREGIEAPRARVTPRP